MVKILIVESEPELCRLMADSMAELGYSPITVTNKDSALEELDRSHIALVTADMNCGGCELCAELRQAGIDTPVTLFWLAKTVYPELFEDIDVTEKTVEYYETVFGVKLTEEQAASIFAPPADAGILGN